MREANRKGVIVGYLRDEIGELVTELNNHIRFGEGEYDIEEILLKIVHILLMLEDRG